jgi:hypothetical protein
MPLPNARLDPGLKLVLHLSPCKHPTFIHHQQVASNFFDCTRPPHPERLLAISCHILPVRNIMGSAASSVANRLRPSANLPAASKSKSKGKNMTTTANPSTTAATARPSHDPHDPKSAVAEEAVEALSQEYAFPHDKLRRRLRGANKTPLVLVACGSFSPVTVLHLDMFELAERHIERTKFEIVGNYMSPCSDTYGKSSLVPVHHRIEM